MTTTENLPQKYSLQKVNFAQASEDKWLEMFGSTAKGLPLVKSGKFAADVLKFAPHGQTEVHTHPGDHILFILEGKGMLVFNGRATLLSPNDCYFVPGLVPHQIVAANNDFILLSIANDHRPVDSPERMEVV